MTRRSVSYTVAQRGDVISLNLWAADNGRTHSDRLSACPTLHSDTNLISHPPTSPRESQLVSQSHVYMCVPPSLRDGEGCCV